MRGVHEDAVRRRRGIVRRELRGRDAVHAAHVVHVLVRDDRAAPAKDDLQAVGVELNAVAHHRGPQDDGAGNEHQGTVSLGQYRYAISAEYKDEDWQIRSEYIHSTGYGFKTTKQSGDDAADATVNYAQGNKADGVYALCIAPIIRQKLRAKARYDMYRKSGSWADSRTQYEVGLNYLFCKNLELQAEYAFINDRSLAKHNYSMLDVELSVRF